MLQINDKFIKCSKCFKGYLKLDNENSNSAVCGFCKTVFPVENQIIDLLPDIQADYGFAQKLMESYFIGFIYESSLWRRSWFFKQFTGISFEDEYKTILKAGQTDKAKQVLEIACGPGIYLRPIAKTMQNAVVTGIDMSMPMLNYASNRSKKELLSNVLLIRGNALTLPFDEFIFDHVNCCGALHLFPDVNQAIEEIYRVLVPNGRFTLGVFRRPSGFLGSFYSKLQKILISVDSFSPEEMDEKLTKIGFTDIKVHHCEKIWLIMNAVKPDK